jgi:hypothetical protein
MAEISREQQRSRLEIGGQLYWYIRNFKHFVNRDTTGFGACTTPSGVGILNSPGCLFESPKTENPPQ